MRVFVDTEFTDFIDCDLISVGLVAEDGREFYGERSDFDMRACSEFVRAAVLPQLGQHPGRVFTRDALAVEFARMARSACARGNIDAEFRLRRRLGIVGGSAGRAAGKLFGHIVFSRHGKTVELRRVNLQASQYMVPRSRSSVYFAALVFRADF